MPVYISSRLYADSPDEAAMRIREEYGDGRLTLREAILPGWYEYVVEVESADGNAPTASLGGDFYSNRRTESLRASSGAGVVA